MEKIEKLLAELQKEVARFKGAQTFDFGNGPVPAHRHPNGGGWVADTATVADTAFVGPNARVFDNALVSDNDRIYGHAWVYGNAWVWDGVHVLVNARVLKGNITKDLS
jgi:UDP-3-O-[3-hydroxymyristoyl] glucosamine N-acyltransferase